MKQCLSIIIFAIICSCSKSDSFPRVDQTGRKIFYNSDEYSKRQNKTAEVVIIDTACINLKQKALNDIKANKLTYYFRIGPNEEEFKAALKKYNISAERGNLPSCIINGRFFRNCYEQEMVEEVYRRYGNKFFDSIWNKTLLDHMKKFPNDSIVEGGKMIRWKDVYKSLLK